jgi:ubiquinone/menaquinone biosynthesis C-methylase UbiE
METDPTSKAGVKSAHSEAYFGHYRDFWWNIDFVELTARRLNWARRRRVLEVGCGAGHWARIFSRFLAPGTCVTCVDRDPKWADPSQAWVRAINSDALKLTVESADAYSLPFPDATFDFVTCQTLLLHLADPQRAVAEMLRVLEPGGLLLCVEPDNFAVAVASETSLSRTDTLDAETAAYRFAAAQARGRLARGLGNFSVGGRLPGMFAAAGLTEILVRLSDRAIPLYPPYSAPAQSALLGDMEQWYVSGPEFDRDEACRNYLAGGGSADDFDRLWTQSLARRERFREAIMAKRYDEGGGSLVYLVSGIKP